MSHSTFASVYSERRGLALRIEVVNDTLGVISVGTGWLLSKASLVGTGKSICLIATASHVLEKWIHASTHLRVSDHRNHTVFDGSLDAKEVVLSVAIEDIDLTIAKLNVRDEDLQGVGEPAPMLATMHAIIDPDGTKVYNMIGIGEEVCWIGYPGFLQSPKPYFHKPTPVLCVGRVAAIGTRNGQVEYLVDGNINKGMSGGPAFFRDGGVVGCVMRIEGSKMRSFDEPAPHPFGALLPSNIIVEAMQAAFANADVRAEFGMLLEIKHIPTPDIGVKPTPNRRAFEGT